MKCILGKKIEMSQVWTDKGQVVPVTVLEAGPCYIAQIKTKEKDGYAAVQLGLGARKSLTKPMRGHLQGLPQLRWLRECKISETELSSVQLAQSLAPCKLKRGDVVDVSQFQPGDMVKVTGVSKGKGFQGVVKRHHFHGHPPTHGHKDQERMPGAIGAGGVQHVFKGTRMAGHMGAEQVTVHGLKVVAVDKEKNQLTVKGAVPGARGGLVIITG